MKKFECLLCSSYSYYYELNQLSVNVVRICWPFTGPGPLGIVHLIMLKKCALWSIWYNNFCHSFLHHSVGIRFWLASRTYSNNCSSSLLFFISFFKSWNRLTPISAMSLTTFRFFTASLPSTYSEFRFHSLG